MSSFDLLADEDLIYQKKQPTRNKKKTKQQHYEKSIIPETEFTKIHLSEVWVVILKYFDFKSLYTSFLFVDKKVCEILYSLEFQKYILNREFEDVLSGEYESDHSALYSQNQSLQRSLMRVLEINDRLNIFELRKTHSKPKSDHPHKVFENLFFGLLNKRTNFTNRNMKLRKLIKVKVSIGTRSEVEFDSYKRGKMKLFRSANENGFGMVETIPDVHKEERKQMECEHFNILVSRNGNDPDYPFTLRCKTCDATGLPWRDTVQKQIQKYL